MKDMDTKSMENTYTLFVICNMTTKLIYQDFLKLHFFVSINDGIQVKLEGQKKGKKKGFFSTT
jgi:hypothetical protein